MCILLVSPPGCVTWGESFYLSEPFSVPSSVKWEDLFFLAGGQDLSLDSHASAGSSLGHLRGTCRGLVDMAVPVEPWRHLGRADSGVSSGE